MFSLARARFIVGQAIVIFDPNEGCLKWVVTIVAKVLPLEVGIRQGIGLISLRDLFSGVSFLGHYIENENFGNRKCHRIRRFAGLRQH
ncbi:MAG: hypothetical protein ACI9G1_002480 [Pirellulaceae bacterium]|jgi:hypothetical protein